MTRRIHIFGGGTVEHVRPHLALCAPAYGGTARRLAAMFKTAIPGHEVHLELTRMAGGRMETAAHVSDRLADLVADPATHIIVMSAALCDFVGEVARPLATGLFVVESDPLPPLQCGRLSSAEAHLLELRPLPKLIDTVRQVRKDIFLIGFKTTVGVGEDHQFHEALKLLKRASCNLVLGNDLQTRRNMVVTPEQSRYAVTERREDALLELVMMAASRSIGKFVRTTVVPGQTVAWDDPAVPAALRAVVDHCRSRGAFLPFEGRTVGHFGCRLGADEFLFSRRKVDFNVETSLVRCRVDGDQVVATGARPSAGAATQRELFRDHPGYDCVVHFHCPLRKGASAPVRDQFAFECGSKDCGQNTSEGMEEVAPGIKAVYLDQHGPNVLFRSDGDPAAVVAYIESHFDLGSTTRSAARGAPAEKGAETSA